MHIIIYVRITLMDIPSNLISNIMRELFKIISNRLKENTITIFMTIIFFFGIVWHFSHIMFSTAKASILESWFYVIPEFALFFLFVHLTIGYTLKRYVATWFCWGLFLSIVAISIGFLLTYKIATTWIRI